MSKSLPRLTPARYLVLVGLLLGLAAGAASLGMRGRFEERDGPTRTVREFRGLWFSPYYESVERRTPGGFETRWEVRAASATWLILPVSLVCFGLLVRVSLGYGPWFREAERSHEPPAA